MSCIFNNNEWETKKNESITITIQSSSLVYFEMEKPWIKNEQ